MRTLAFTAGHGLAFTATRLGESADPQARTRVVKLEGWVYGTTPGTEWVQRLSDGLFPAETRHGGRKLTLGAREWFSTPRETITRAREVGASFPSGFGIGSLTVSDEFGVVSALGLSIDGNRKVRYSVDSGMVEWELPLISPEPYLYGEAQRGHISTALGGDLVFPLFDDATGVTTGIVEWGEIRTASVTLTNTGNATAYPVLTVSGEMSGGFVLDVGGRRIVYELPVSPQSPVVVDMRGSVTAGGSDQSWALAVREWSGVEPGQSVTPQLRALSGGDGWAEVELRPTYL